MTNLRIGHGYDVHRLVEDRALVLGGVEIPWKLGLLGHSDADVLTHAVMDALSGAARLGDIGKLFPDTDPAYKGISSMKLLARVGSLLQEKGFDIRKQHMDCGIEIFDSDLQGTEAGGSGCGCAATVLSAFILKQIEEGIWKKVLFIPTGALLSKTSFNEGKSVPGIAHAVVIESYK